MSLMQKHKSFPLRLNDQDRERARALAKQLGVSENRLYADIIRGGLLMREQMAYLEKLRAMAIPPLEGLETLKDAPDVEPDAEDRP
jgi:Zn-dependent peptidase ImmA (M78 family)